MRVPINPNENRAGTDLGAVAASETSSPSISPMSITAAQIAEQLQGEVIGDGSTPLTGFASADLARAGDLTFAEKEAYFTAADASAAAAIIVSGPFTSATKVLIRVPNARIAVARVLPVFFPPDESPRGIHPSGRSIPPRRAKPLGRPLHMRRARTPPGA